MEELIQLGQGRVGLVASCGCAGAGLSEGLRLGPLGPALGMQG